MDNTVRNNPTPEQMKLIWKDTYNLYLKWKDIDKDEDFTVLAKEVHELKDKYNFSICHDMLVDLYTVIEKDYKVRKGIEI